GTVAKGTKATVQFKVHVDSPPPSQPAQYDNSASWTYQYVNCASPNPQNGQFTTNTVTTRVPVVGASKTVSPGTAVPNDTLTYRVTSPNTGTADAAGVTLTDPIPAGTTYVAGTTKLNGGAIADMSGQMPFAQGGLVNSQGAPAGQVNAGQTATVQFQV